MEEQLQLVIRRRRGDGLDGVWLGYDLYLGKNPTGKIVMGWDIDSAGNFTYQYADEPPEVTHARKNVKVVKPPANDLLEPPLVSSKAKDTYMDTIVSLPDDFQLALSSDDFTVTENSQSSMAGAVERFIVSFDWHYGSEQIILDSLDQVAPWRKSVEDKFSDLNPTNWKLRRERVVVEDLQWPG